MFAPPSRHPRRRDAGISQIAVQAVLQHLAFNGQIEIHGTSQMQNGLADDRARDLARSSIDRQLVAGKILRSHGDRVIAVHAARTMMAVAWGCSFQPI
jgi:hypothetical protein